MFDEEYIKAQKMAIKSFRKKSMRGQYPYLPVLEHLTRYGGGTKEVYLGVMELPLDLVVGTTTESRSNSFGPNFMPLLSPESEFAMKWENLYLSHMEEGIHDSIKCYEYMNRFYVEEGNKRVSVLKFTDAVSVSAVVYRILPEYNENDKDCVIYYEFLKFFELTGLYSFTFSRTGSYRELVKATGNSMTKPWSTEEILELRSLYNHFQLAFDSKEQERYGITIGDALLRLMKIYTYEALCKDSVAELKTRITKAREELELLTEPEEVELKLEPTEKTESTVKQLVHKFSGNQMNMTVGFVYEKTPAESGWTYAHDLGRIYVQEKYPELIVKTYDNCMKDNDPEGVIRRAIEDGCGVIFTTSPRLMDASVKLAVEYPSVRILNCSIRMPYKSVRTYYGRLYETKFLSGLIAGAMAEDNRIAYVADYPIYGMIPCINAFAIGARMSNPRATIKLIWSRQKGVDVEKELEGISVISQLEMPGFGGSSKNFGLYMIKDGKKVDLAVPVWNWGKFYARVLENIRYGIWKAENDKKALNYWWGISSGIVDILLSPNVPYEIERLVNILKEGLRRDVFHVFDSRIVAQGGRVIAAGDDAHMDAKALAEMDWLYENVEGMIPEFNWLDEEARAVSKVQGVKGETDEDLGHS